MKTLFIYLFVPEYLSVYLLFYTLPMCTRTNENQVCNKRKYPRLKKKIKNNK